MQIIVAEHITVSNCRNKQYHFFKHSLLILIPDHGYLQSWECGDVVPVSFDGKPLACSALKGKKLCSVVCHVDVCLCMGKKIGIILCLILKFPFSVLFQYGCEVAPTSHRNFGSKCRYFQRLKLLFFKLHLIRLVLYSERCCFGSRKIKINMRAPFHFL